MGIQGLDAVGVAEKTSKSTHWGRDKIPRLRLNWTRVLGILGSFGVWGSISSTGLLVWGFRGLCRGSAAGYEVHH